MSTSLTPNPLPQPQKKRQSKPSSLADTLREWESLLSAVSDHSADLTMAEPFRAALAASVDKLKGAKGVQELHRATKQASTQLLKEILRDGKDQAIRLRDSIRAALGPTTELLTQFGIAPQRGRSARRATPAETPAPVPAPQPEAEGHGNPAAASNAG